MSLGWWLVVGYIALIVAIIYLVLLPIDEQLARDWGIWLVLSTIVVFPLIANWEKKRNLRD